MKNIICVTIVTGLLILQSCSEKGKTIDDKDVVKLDETLAGKVYGLSDQMDSAKCERIPPGTDYYQTFLFLNDSIFIKVINTCCGDIGEDFASAWYYTGKYKMSNKELTLTFDPKVAVYYYKSIENPKSDTLLSSTHVELETADIVSDKLPRFNCKSFPYFKQLTGEWKDQLMALSTDTLENCINEMKHDGVWDKLFYKK